MSCYNIMKTEVQIRNDVLIKKKNMLLTRRNCGLEDSRYKVFVNEEFRKETVKVFKATRGLKGIRCEYV